MQRPLVDVKWRKRLEQSPVTAAVDRGVEALGCEAVVAREVRRGHSGGSYSGGRATPPLLA
jgi:hypothetical protein